jgi:hypothetical protein
MTTELERAAQIDADIKAADKARKDAEEETANHGEKLDNILKCLDSLGKRMDAYDAEREEAKGKEKKPVEEAGEFEKLPRGDGEEPEQFGDPKKLAADSRRKDSQTFRKDSDAEESRTLKPKPAPLMRWLICSRPHSKPRGSRRECLGQRCQTSVGR